MLPLLLPLLLLLLTMRTTAYLGRPISTKLATVAYLRPTSASWESAAHTSLLFLPRTTDSNVRSNWLFKTISPLRQTDFFLESGPNLGLFLQLSQ